MSIYDKLLSLPQESYPEEEVNTKADLVYQHIFTNYYGGGVNAYNQNDK